MKTRKRAVIATALAMAAGLLFAPAASADENTQSDGDKSAEMNSLQVRGISATINVDAATGEVIAYENVAAEVGTDGFLEIEPGATGAEIRAQIHAALLELAGKQNPEEIEVLSKLPGTHFLVIDDNGVYASAVNTGSPKPSLGSSK